MSKFISKSLSFAFFITTVLFTFIPESFFGKIEFINQNHLEKIQIFNYFEAQDINIIVFRVMFFVIVFIFVSLIYAIILNFQNHVTIKGHNYLIEIRYGDIFKYKNSKRVINFDECFTTHIGDLTADINSTSICGQYLLSHPDLDIQQLIDTFKITPAKGKSKYQNKSRYSPGTIIPNGDDLLMAFAKLDEKGKGRFFSRDEYLDCLDLLWKELENYYADKDVYIPVLGSGTTSFDGSDGASFTQQELLDIMICSYKLSSHKIKAPHKLCIVCRKNDGFSINRIENS